VDGPLAGNEEEVAEQGPRTLESLRTAPEAAWLWDAARARIVWANRAGVSAFGAQSLFDLIDRPFDPAEPGVERVTELAKTLARGESEGVLLHFPSTGQTVPLACRCSLHALADGRSGVLAVAQVAVAPNSPVPLSVIEQAFDVMPLAASFIDREGQVLRLNVQAQQMFGASPPASLAVLTGDMAESTELLRRLEAAATVSTVRTVAALLGRRELRITLQRLAADGTSPHLVLLDDITDRRLLERRLEGLNTAGDAEVPVLAAAEALAFETLGRTLSHAVAAAPALAPAAVPTTVLQPTAKPRRHYVPVPANLAEAMDRAERALVITQNDGIVHLNRHALTLFGYESNEDAINDEVLWKFAAPLRSGLADARLDLGNGMQFSGSAHVSSIAWQNGPAREILFRPVVRRDDSTAPTPVVETPAAARPPETEAEAQAPRPAPAVDTAPAAGVADDELRAILDTASDGIITLDKDGKIHTFSGGAEAIFGYRLAEVADRPLADLLTPDSRKVLKDYLAALQGSGLASVFNDGREVTAVVKQGGNVPLFLTIGTLAAARSTARFCAVVRDITNWKRTESELRQARDKAEEISRQKSDFLARISHELRTPLNAIMGFSEVMQMERFGEIRNEKYRGYVNDIHASGSHLLSLINDLLDLSKVEAGKLELNFTAVSLPDVVDHAVRMLQDAATRARVVMRKSLPQGLPLVVADLRSMRQIVINLLSNAIKFTEPGGQVIVSALVAGNGELALRIKDTGIGMSAPEIRDALEPFKRVETDGREREGTGLGLPLTRALAEANRARFDITSEPRKGTQVDITFPVTRVLAE
jgi:PAS domain S-box-containing protein